MTSFKSIVRSTVRPALLCALGIGAGVLGGCQSSGTFHMEIECPLTDIVVDVTWGPPTTLPPGARLKGTVVVEGRIVEIYCDANGCLWGRVQGSSSFHKLHTGDVPPVPDSGPTGDTPGQRRPGQVAWGDNGSPGELGDDGDPCQQATVAGGGGIPIGNGEYFFDDEANVAWMEFVLPADYAGLYVDPAGTQFSVTTAETEWLDDGSLFVRYQGTPNSVLGMAMLSGLSTLERWVPGVGFVTFELSPEYSAVLMSLDGEPYEDDPMRLIYAETVEGVAGP